MHGRGGEFRMFFVDNNHKKGTLMYWLCTAQEIGTITEINCTAVSDLAINGTIEELVLMEDSFGIVYEGVDNVSFYNLNNFTE